MKNHKEESQIYFKSRSVYKKLFPKIRDKYESLGHLGGTVLLTNLTLEEREQLGGFLQKDYTRNKSVTVSAVGMQKALKDSRFSELSWEEILEGYFYRPLQPKTEQLEKQQKARQTFFQERMDKADEAGRKWLEKVLEEKTDGYQTLVLQYREDSQKLQERLDYVLDAVKALPYRTGETKRLAVFAAIITGDPHFFDDGTKAQHLLLSYLRFCFLQKGDKGKTGLEQKNQLWYMAGILKDELSNNTLAYGLRAKRKDNTLHPGLEGFLELREPVSLSLFTIGQLKEVWSQSSAGPVIYIVENPSVFSSLIEKDTSIAAICTNGQPRTATLALLDLIGASYIFYYAGDFDPEGLLIAQNMKKRYGERLSYWNYKVEYYEENLSDVTLKEQRLKKLEGVFDMELQEIKYAMKREKRAAYQEKMIEYYETGNSRQKSAAPN